ncbi:MAG: alanine--tRNA ligase [Candidatus Woesearchaeota archaeon]
MDKKIKQDFKKKASANPDDFYATEFLKKQGFIRQVCNKCNTYFWSVNKRDVCGDPSCCDGFSFFEDNPSNQKLSYSKTWSVFSDHMKSKGYTPITRYPVVARWRDDTDFVQASIYDFQPYVVSGEVEPPANPLIVPQFCVRFNDVDNVGVTMSHFTGFVMIGQHAFVSKEEWDQDKYFSDLYLFFVDVLGIDKEELVMHEDAWAGGGNFGPCMEIFCRGMELANQVYMLYERKEDDITELKLKVLDMGMGHERVCWFTQGKRSAYDAVFPKVMENLYSKTGFNIDDEFFNKYVKYAPYLNLDEVEDLDKAWKDVSEKTGIELGKIQEVLPKMSAIYSIAEHVRSLVFTISDGALPSNVKGGYNLRVILRRALSFIDKYEWNIDIRDVARWHAEELKNTFPELLKNIEHVVKILGVEIDKYRENKKRTKQLIKKVIRKDVTTDMLIELYDSQGVDPEDIKKEAEKEGVVVKIPDNFYMLVSERHEVREVAEKQKDKIEGFEEVVNTTPLYFDHFDLVDFSGYVLKIKDDFVALNQTAFYPTSGGQQHDLGEINGCRVVDVVKQGGVILHKVENINFKEGDKVYGKVDYNRREQLTQHHTATHILTGSVRRLLGDHVWQAGAAKTVEKGRLDITHFQQLSDSDILAIEKLANDVVKQNLPVYKSFMSRSKAEAAHGIRIYQGGAVPGKELRIVNIQGFDVEACGGTHVDVTGDVSSIRISKTSKIQDGVVRIEFVAGKACEDLIRQEQDIIKESSMLLECQEDLVVFRAKELFDKWKQAKKGKLKEFKFESTQKHSGNTLKQTAEVLKTQPEHIVKTIKRFKLDIEKKLA